ELVHQRDIDVALRVLDDFRRLGDLDARRPVRARGDDAAVQRIDELGRFRRRAGRDLADRRKPVLLVAGIDALGAVAGIEITVQLEARFLLDDRDAELLGAARIDGRLVDDDVPFRDHLSDRPARALQRGQHEGQAYYA